MLDFEATTVTIVVEASVVTVKIGCYYCFVRSSFNQLTAAAGACYATDLGFGFAIDCVAGCATGSGFSFAIDYVVSYTVGCGSGCGLDCATEGAADTIAACCIIDYRIPYYGCAAG